MMNKASQKKTNQKKNTTGSVTSRRNLKDCWIRENDRYTHTDDMVVGTLPYVKGNEVIVLQENNIPYRASQRYGKEVFEYWNPDSYAEETVEAPVYAQVLGKYTNMGETYTAAKPTADTIKSAQEMRNEIVSKLVEEYHKDRKLWRLCHEAKEALDGGLARFKEVKHTSYFKYRDIQVGENHIKCFPVVDAKGNYLEGVVFFDVNKIASGATVTVQVPEDMIGWIIGRNGAKVSKWAAELGVERIELAH